MEDIEKNSITVDNANTSNGITLNTKVIYLQNSGLTPATEMTNLLTINSNGKIDILISSTIHKDKIKNIRLDQSFDQL